MSTHFQRAAPHVDDAELKKSIRKAAFSTAEKLLRPPIKTIKIAPPKK